MFSFRQKIFITYVFVFLVLIAMMFPFAQRAVKDIVKKSMEDRALELISKIKSAPNDEALIRNLKEQKALIFFRVSVITNERKVLYDSHTKGILGPRFSREYIVSHPEVLQAFREGSGYAQEYSQILNQEFAYFAKSFPFHEKTYVLRTAFPLQYVEEITKDFEFGFLGSAIAILLLFSVMTWFIINYLTRPIQQIITAVKPYQEGASPTIPQIFLKPKNRSDEFGKLASTLNSLSIKIRSHIDSLTKERNEKEAVLESLVEGVIAVDNQNRIIFANTMACKLLGTKLPSILNKPVEAIQQPKCSELVRLCQQEGKVLTDTLEIKLHSKRRHFDLVAAPKKDATGAILVLQDKTEHYKLIEMRKDFVANASHELKTPITIIQGFAEALHDNPGLPIETSSEITSKIVRNCIKMTMLIKDLLTLTDIEHIPESRLLETDLLELIQTVESTVQDAYPDAVITVHSNPDEQYFLLADPYLLELAFNNLIENAAKYSPPPAKVNVTLKQIKNGVRIDISDQGYGIPKKELENIFQRFYRVDTTRAKKVGGSGLGLSIVETIIAKHFGEISVTSEEGKGSTFTIFLPSQRER
ncbi:putative sensor histidine kinase [Waddlia chondrophila 2032/99]|uniref:histidine kinase n=1 Tax=Waddlia chondrophila 2032/99 TaxID=765953 RepID=F8LB08_9BACT|nr:putative sensor histidine kinase [Waddlia chondrophila 2032/99]